MFPFQRIAIACDHAALDLRDHIASHLRSRGLTVIDLGPDRQMGAVDYPDYARKVTQAVLDDQADAGILVCGSGIGMSITANRYAGIRCALCADIYSARMTRLHNDANVLALGANVVGQGLALDIVDFFVDTPFSGGGRHISRIAKIDPPDCG